jgi:hypothetical protein
MESNLKKIKNEIEDLLDKGMCILNIMEVKKLKSETEKTYEELYSEQPKEDRDIFINFVNNFKIVSEYETWYSKSLKVIQLIQPDRINDFKLLYKNEKRKKVDYETYTLSDYLINLTNVLRSYCPESAIPKFQVQLGILRSAYDLFDSSVANIQDLLAADLFDSELDSASELLKKKFYRASGVIAGVVLEKHLKSVCMKHGIKITKKNINLSELNELLYNNKTYELETSREIQLYTDLRNLCSHDKKREPSAEDIQKLISGVNSVIKSIF